MAGRLRAIDLRAQPQSVSDCRREPALAPRLVPRGTRCHRAIAIGADRRGAARGGQHRLVPRRPDHQPRQPSIQRGDSRSGRFRSRIPSASRSGSPASSPPSFAVPAAAPTPELTAADGLPVEVRPGDLRPIVSSAVISSTRSRGEESLCAWWRSTRGEPRPAASIEEVRSDQPARTGSHCRSRPWNARCDVDVSHDR